MEKTILFVGGEMKVLRIKGGFLLKEGFIFHLCNSAEEALSLCDEVHFDMVVADCYLWKISGKELIDKLKERSPKVKIVLISENFKFDEEIFTIKKVDAFLRRPFKVRDLRILLESIFKK